MAEIEEPIVLPTALALKKIGIENLPNVYFKNVEVFLAPIEHPLDVGAALQVRATVSLFDFAEPKECLWLDRGIISEYLEIQSVFIGGTSPSLVRTKADQFLSGQRLLTDLRVDEKMIISGEPGSSGTLFTWWRETQSAISSTAATAMEDFDLRTDPGYSPLREYTKTFTFRTSPGDSTLILTKYKEETEKLTGYVFTQAFLNLDRLKQDHNLDLNYTEHQHYLGPLRAEKVLRNGEVVENATIFYNSSLAALSTARGESAIPAVHWGAIHSLGGGEYMEGSFHRSSPHSSLRSKTINNQTKITLSTNLNNDFASNQQAMSYSGESREMSFVMEPEISFTSDLVLNGVVAIDTHDLALKNDFFYRKLNSVNPEFLNRTREGITIDSISLKRIEVHSSVYRNRLGTKKDASPKSSFKETNLVTSGDVNGKIKSKTSYRLLDNTIHSLSPEELENSGTSWSGKGLPITYEDIEQATERCSIEEHPIFDNRIRFISFKDSSISYEGGNKYKYGLEIQFSTSAKEVIKGAIKELEEAMATIAALQKKSILPSGYDFKTKSFKKDFFIEMNSRYGFDLTANKKTGQLNYLRRRRSSLKRSALWIQASLLYYAGLKLVGVDNKKHYKKMFSLLNPIVASPTSFLTAEIMFRELIENTRKFYNLQDDLSGTSEGSGTGRGGKNIQHKSFTKFYFNKTVDAQIPKDAGFEFLPTNQGSITITKSQFRARVGKEKKKFFLNTPSLSAQHEGLSSIEGSSLVNLNSSAYSFFTPQTIRMGGIKKDLLTNKADIFDVDFFQRLSTLKASIHEGYNKTYSFSSDQNIDALSSASGIQITGYLRSNITKKINTLSDQALGVKQYLGRGTHLSNLAAMESYEAEQTDEEKDGSQKLLTSLVRLRNNRATNNISMDNFNLTHRDSKIRGLFNGRNSNRIAGLPLSVRALILDSNEQSSTRFSFVGGKFDALKNIQTAESIKQNFLNIRKLEYLVGFEAVNGKVNMNRPRWKTVSQKSVQANKNLVCRLVDYELSELGIEKAIDELPTYNSVFIMRDK